MQCGWRHLQTIVATLALEHPFLNQRLDHLLQKERRAFRLLQDQPLERLENVVIALTGRPRVLPLRLSLMGPSAAGYSRFSVPTRADTRVDS